MSNFNAFFDYIQKLSGIILSENEKHVFLAHFKPRKLLKRQYFLQQGDVCKYAGFVVKGSAKTFRIDDKGHEHILKLSMEEWWLADFESYYHLTPSRYNIQALEDLELLMVTNAQVEDFFSTIPAFIAMQEVIKQNYAIANQNRVQAALSYTAEERYDDLVANYPHFLQRFPLNVIASYLGLSPETLSRIRKNASKS
ncbi:Crp/Fnr family transcriptional regulator [Mucilaginibacter conchicola]|uniref:Crp/Fnr family transcriptional regulator n=1 Tax=Mucilaginibacter conchicola TaxID=2303333 RepID=A0A372NNV7_9SPHI|nr:Crp/Fnr family transcriptional regulator [Mucilaginibacter conchicola]RFZ89923.1 Crp/Fnr family transcriptional regulator [Mucilaginibacter conchicola]